MKTQPKNMNIPWGSPFHWIIPLAFVIGFLFGANLVYKGDPLIGGFMAVFCFIPIFLREGVSIEFDNNRLRIYWSFLGLRFGDWERLDKYKYLVVLRSEGTLDTDYDEISLGVGAEKVIQFHLFLATANHLKRVMLSTFDNQNDALEAARNMSDDLGLEFVKYNPGKTVHQKRY